MSRNHWLELGRIVLLALFIALGARVAVPLPGTDVPQTAQTLAVLAAGLVLGPRSGALAVCLYVVLGTIGLPVFAAGTSGWERLTGPTGGYLAGFVGAAALAGWWRRRGLTRLVLPALGGMVLGHLLILVLGWVRLAAAIGAGSALERGVAPFLAGGLVKSALAALFGVWLARRRPAARDRRIEPWYDADMAFSERLATRVRAILEPRFDVTERKMFGGLCFMVRGHMACGIVGDELMVRVGKDAHEEALGEPGAREMDFTGRPMRGMVYVAAEAIAGDWLQPWVERGVAHAESLPPK